MSAFEGILQHPDPVVVDVASMMQKFTEQFQAGEMTAAEYKEVTLDLIDMQHVYDLTDDVHRRSEIAKAFQQIMQIAGIIGKFI